MSQNKTRAEGAKDAAKAAYLLVTVATSLNERLAVTAGELARSQDLLREASEELMTAFRGAADRMVAAQKVAKAADVARSDEYGLALEHLYQAVEHLQSHDLVNQLIDAQKQRMNKMREKLSEALALAKPPVADPAQPEMWLERSRAMLDCIVAGIAAIDEESRVGSDRKKAGSVDLF